MLKFGVSHIGKRSLKLTCEQISFLKFSGGKPRTPIQKAGEENEEGKGNRGGKGERWDGRGRVRSIPKIKFYDYSTAYTDNNDINPHNICGLRSVKSLQHRINDEWDENREVKV
jgi:hypothetical protein